MRKNYQNRRPQRPKRKVYPKDIGLTVTVREGNVDAALRVLKKKVKRAGLIQELKDREFHETRREKRRKIKLKAIRRNKRTAIKEYEEAEIYRRQANYRR